MLQRTLFWTCTISSVVRIAVEKADPSRIVCTFSWFTDMYRYIILLFPTPQSTLCGCRPYGEQEPALVTVLQPCIRAIN